MSGSFYLSLLTRCCTLFLLACMASLSVAKGTHTSALSLESVLYLIKQNDFRLKQLQQESDAHSLEADAFSYLPDPTVFAAIQSLPTDTFALDQEPMTQLRIGVKQMFPKGDVLDIRSDMSLIKADLQLKQSQLRWLMRKKEGEQAWLEAWYWQRNLTLLDEDDVFLSQVQEFIQSLYEVGAKNQSDLIGADVELIKLKEKRIEANRQYQIFRQQLNRLANETLSGEHLAKSLPDLAQKDFTTFQNEEIDSYLLTHPRVTLLNQNMVMADKKVDLVQQDFEPAWGIEVSYGLRDGDNMDGSERADFFSAGVNMQIPLFSDGKQRQNTLAAKHRLQVAQLKRDEVLSEMRFEVESLLQQYRFTHKQRELYETEILPTLEEQKKSALQSYESDQGNFQFVLALYLKQQSAKAMHQRLRVNEQKHISSLNYLLGLDVTRIENGAN